MNETYGTIKLTLNDTEYKGGTGRKFFSPMQNVYADRNQISIAYKIYEGHTDIYPSEKSACYKALKMTVKS